MNKIAVCEKFKTTDKIYLPDERIKSFIHHNNKYLDHYYQSIELLSLHEKVPKEIVI